MAVIKLSDKKWLARIRYRDQDGNIKSKDKRFPTRKEALKFESNFLSAVNKPDDQLSYRDLFEAYIERNKITANPESIREKERIANNFWPQLFDKKVTLISKRDYLNAWIKITKTDYSISYKNKAITLLKSIGNFGYLYYNIEDSAKTLEQLARNSDELTQNKVWTIEQFNHFITFVDNEVYKAYFILLFNTGLRRGEAKALLKDDLKNNKLSINKSMRHNKDGFRPLKTASSKRIISLDINTLEVLKPSLATEGDFLFGGLEPLSNSNIQRTFTKATKEAGLPAIRLHDLRHSHATILINNDANIVAVSRRLGHSDVQMTLRVYTHLLQESDDKLIKILENITK